MRSLRFFLAYCTLSLLMALLHLILGWPDFPATTFGWLALLFLPVPVAVAGEWLLEYREVRLLRWLDAFGDRIDRSQYRLAIISALLVLVCALCSVALLHFNGL